VSTASAVTSADGHGLGGIDDAAAADRGAHVGTLRNGDLDPFPDQFDGRLAVHREHRGHPVRADPDMNMNDQHGFILLRSSA
jgi:hypothetical protein